jgi:predicted metal-binding membrane protein
MSEFLDPAPSHDGFHAIAVALAATVGLAAVSWVFTVLQMKSRDTGMAMGLGSFGSFIGLWIAMMAAMMLPGVTPTVLRGARASGSVHSAPQFVALYLAVWALVGIAVYLLYRPHGTLVAGVAIVAAGVYELTPIKQYFRRRCRESVQSGSVYGLWCVGSSIGLMVMLIALGVMSIAGMGITSALIVAQKLLPARIAIDAPLAAAIIGLGILMVYAPSSIPGLMRPI